MCRGMSVWRYGKSRRITGKPVSYTHLYKGHVEDTVFQLIGGLRSGMGYCGAKDIETLKESGQFVKDVYKRQH